MHCQLDKTSSSTRMCACLPASRTRPPVLPPTSSSRCYKLPLANNAAVPNTLRKEMAGVCKACFAGDSSRVRAGHMQVRSGGGGGAGYCCLDTAVSNPTVLRSSLQLP